MNHYLARWIKLPHCLLSNEEQTWIGNTFFEALQSGDQVVVDLIRRKSKDWKPAPHTQYKSDGTPQV